MIVEEYEWHVGHLLIRARDDPRRWCPAATGWASRGPVLRGRAGCHRRRSLRSWHRGSRQGWPPTLHAGRFSQRTSWPPANRCCPRERFRIRRDGRGRPGRRAGVPQPVPQAAGSRPAGTGDSDGRTTGPGHGAGHRAGGRSPSPAGTQANSHRANQRSAEGRDRAEALSRARSALFNAVTHELSTPVHAPKQPWTPRPRTSLPHDPS